MRTYINLSTLIYFNLAIIFLGGIIGCDTEDVLEDPFDASLDGMVIIPAGEFEMGSNDDEAGGDEQPVHTVYVDAFYMDQYEVTNREFKEFLLENPGWQKDRIEKRFRDANYLKDWNGNEYPDGKGDHPVVNVSWYAAVAYANWANKRLPTEAEWERAARGGLVGKKYPHGDTIIPMHANYDKNVGGTTAVGVYPANNYNLHDMAGNVWEWCLDEYNEDFYSLSPSENPLSGASSLSQIIDNFRNVKSSRILRGGSWFDIARNVRVTPRNWNTPPNSYFNIGFRCVIPVDP
ncbi:hypothetical protein C6496_10725 [Candidatus Poribacteria bacterium]|nr:MAG: hypothetical protein C6496_10725 [Candidatus Poribacteria bacterium]